jgi:hypothetical protein
MRRLCGLWDRHHFQIAGGAVNCINKGDFYGLTVRMQSHPFSLLVLSPEHRKMMERVHLHQPAASYEARPNQDSDAHLPWNQALVVKYSRLIFEGGEPALMRAWQDIPGSVLVALLEQVRTRVLRFALDLRDSLPEDASSASVVPAADIDRSVVQIFYGGNNLIATNTAHASQVVQQSVNQNDLGSLIHALKELGITDEGVDELRKSIEHKTADTKAENARTWAADIGKYIGKEGVRMGVEVAKRTALHWLSQYLGIPL